MLIPYLASDGTTYYITPEQKAEIEKQRKFVVPFISITGEVFYITPEEKAAIERQVDHIKLVEGINQVEEILVYELLVEDAIQKSQQRKMGSPPRYFTNSNSEKERQRYTFFGPFNHIPIAVPSRHIPYINAPLMPLPTELRHPDFQDGYMYPPQSFPPIFQARLNARQRSVSSSGNNLPSPTPVFNHVNNSPPNNINTNNRSLVITNSDAVSTNKSQLNGILFKNKIGLAIPPGITWEELNAPPLSVNEINCLLHYTMDLNAELRRSKKRTRNGKNSTIRDIRPPPNRSQTPLVGSNSIKTVTTSSNKPAEAIKPKAENSATKKKENDTKKSILVPRVFINSNYKKDEVEALIEPSMKLKSEGKRKFEVPELLAMRNDAYENKPLINSLEKFGILSFDSPHAAGLCKRLLIHDERKNSEWVPPTALLHDVKSEPLNWKDILQDSWLESDEEEDLNSIQIYKHLEDMVKNFKDDAVEKTAESDEVKIEPKKKKKKKLKSENSTGQTNVRDENNKDSHDETFDDYFDNETIEEGLKNGTLLKAILRINSKNDQEAFISCQNDEKDIFINGTKDRNRALDGDEVIVQMYLKTIKKNSSTESEESFSQKCGKVVGISTLQHPRTVVGYLRYSFSKKYHGFILHPKDNKVPKIHILRNSVPWELRHPHKCNTRNVACLARITKWEKIKFADGVFLEEIVERNGICVETKCILLENGLDTTPFEQVDKYMPSLPYEIPAVEIEKRVDIRHRCVFTIDPLGAKDLDDALSCTVLPNGNIEVGIHISDVTHFLAYGTPLDQNAREKATTVYLTDAVFHMLPQKLCELCSLTPMEDKLAFSVFVELDEQANVVRHNFCKTIIRSCVQLTYAHAQAVIDGTDISFPPIVNGFTVQDCIDTISHLHSLATKMKARRFKEGALKIDQPKLTFNLSKDGSPLSFSLSIQQECNWLVEEFMLLANILAANRIMEAFPNLALLRYHSAPNEKALSAVVENLEKVGICIETSTAGSICKSMMQYDGTDEIGIARMTVITNLLVKPMMKACYTCSSSNFDSCSDFWHYALNIPFYTHFTSPIRRYADIVVHRLLAGSLGYQEVPDWKPDEISEIANNCNRKKNSAKKASEASAEMYLLRYLEKYGPLRVRAVVIEVRERYFEVVDLSTRSTHRIHVSILSGTNKVHFEETSLPSLHIEWKIKTETYIQIIQLFSIVDVKLSFLSTPDKRIKSRITPTLLKPT